MREEDILRYDRKGMLSLLEGFPFQCAEAEKTARQESLPDAYGSAGNIVLAGMGGSAVGGDLLYNCVSGELEKPFVVLRDYRLPAFVGSGTFFIAASYSGNTEETLASCERAFSRSAKVVAVTSGGELERLCEKHGAPVVKIPVGMPPRTALGYLFFPVLVKLAQAGLIADRKDEIHRTVDLLEDMRGRLRSPGSEALGIARSLRGFLPVIYGSSDVTGGAVLRWRTQINENAKMFACSCLFPEMNHNEIVGLEHPGKVVDNMRVVILRDSNDFKRVIARIEITKKLLEEKSLPVSEVWAEGESALERLFSLVYFGDFVSFYLAILNGVDPWPVERIRILKEKLKEIAL